MEFEQLSSNNHIISLKKEKKSPNIIINILQWHNYLINKIAILLHYTNYTYNRLHCDLQKILLVKNYELHKLTTNLLESHMLVWLNTKILQKDPYKFFNIPHVVSIFILDIIESFRKKTIFLYQTILVLTFPILIYRVHNQISFSKGYQYLPYIIVGEKYLFSLKNTNLYAKVLKNHILYIQQLEGNLGKIIKPHVLLDPIKDLKDKKMIVLSKDIRIDSKSKYIQDITKANIAVIKNKNNHRLHHKTFEHERIVDMLKNMYLAERLSILNIGTKIKEEWEVIDTSLMPTSSIRSDSNNFLLSQANQILSVINELYLLYIQPYKYSSYVYDIYNNINDNQYQIRTGLKTTNELYTHLAEDKHIHKSSVKTEKQEEKNLFAQHLEIDQNALIKSDNFRYSSLKIKIFEKLKRIDSYLLEFSKNQLQYLDIFIKWLTKRHEHILYKDFPIESHRKFFSSSRKTEDFLNLLDSKRNKWRYKTIAWINFYNNKTIKLNSEAKCTFTIKSLQNDRTKPIYLNGWNNSKLAIIKPLIKCLYNNNGIDKNNYLNQKSIHRPYFWSALNFPVDNDLFDISVKSNFSNHRKDFNHDLVHHIKYSDINKQNILNILTKIHFFPKEFIIRPFVHTKITEKSQEYHFLHSLCINKKDTDAYVSHKQQISNYSWNINKANKRIDQAVKKNNIKTYPLKNNIAIDLITYLFEVINTTNKTYLFDNKKLIYLFENRNINKYYDQDTNFYKQEQNYPLRGNASHSFLENPSNKESLIQNKDTLLVNNLNFSKESVKFSYLYNKISDPFLTLPISLLKQNSILSENLQQYNKNILFSDTRRYTSQDKIFSKLDNKKYINNQLSDKRIKLYNIKNQSANNIFAKYNQWILTTQWWDFRKHFICNEIPIFQMYLSDQRSILIRPVLEKIITYYDNLQKNLRQKSALYYENNSLFSKIKNPKKYITEEVSQAKQSIIPRWETLSLYQKLDSRNLVIFGWCLTLCIIYYHWIPLLTGLTYLNIWYKFKKMSTFSRPCWNNFIRMLVHNSIDSASQQVRLKMYASRGWMVWLQSQIWSYCFTRTFLSNYLLHTRSIDLPRRKKNLVVNSLITQKSLLKNYSLSNSNQSIYKKYGYLGQSQNDEGLIFLKKWSQIFYRNPYFSNYQKSLSAEFQWLTDLFFHITSGSNLFPQYRHLPVSNTLKIPKKLPETTIITKRWLLIGASETGKAYLVKNIAADGHFPLVHISLKDIRHATPDLKYNKLKKYNKWIKQLADRGFLLDNILELAKMLSPCILWISDLHEFHAKHNIRHQQGKIYDASLLLTILLKIMGNDLLPERQSNITLVGSTHSPELLDPKFVSRHRLDLIVNLRKPSFTQRQKIFANLLEAHKLNITAKRAFYELGSNSIGYTLRDITGLVNEILLIKNTKNTKVVDTDIVRLAIYRQISKQSANNTLVEHDALQYKIGRALVQSTLVSPKPIFPITLRHDLWKTRFYYLSNAFLEFTIEKSTVTELITLTHIVNCLAGSAARDAFILFFNKLSVSSLGITKQLKHDLSIASSILQALFLEFPMRDLTSSKNRNKENVLGNVRGTYNCTILEKTASSFNFFNRFTSYIYWSYRIQRLSLSWTMLFDNIKKRSQHMILESSPNDTQNYNDASLIDQYIEKHLPYERRVIKRQQKRTKKISYSFHEMVFESQLKTMGLPWVSEYILDYDALQLSILLLETRPIWNPPALNPSYSILFFDRDLVISRNMLTKVYMTYGEKFQSEKLNPKRIKKQVLWSDAAIHNVSINDRTMKQEENIQVDLPDFSNFRKMAKANAQLQQSQLQAPVYLYQGWTGLDHQDNLQSDDLLHHRSLLLNKDLRNKELLIYGTLLDIYHFVLKFFLQNHQLLLNIENQLIEKGLLNREDIEKVINHTKL